ncbi:alpha/beta fold hydrolase [Variovorax sp. PBL-E5]|uniref:alpha/beta fold hydrolase n=1 Tax=Variovorax sp. PBL-E5 TaxID=434014 RepID=UPI0013192C5B|nr:alpha/beta fold hydrolase [Variovorax sp. PBL-E5]VTU24068.1 Dihydrolipoyllysine-residue acetyltransferase component of acetoin cleaving system [Variovorax sp. PBL-E5]
MLINYVRRGEGKTLLLIHGLGSNWRSWQTIMAPLATERSVVAIDLPGFGKSPPLEGEVSIRALADAVTRFLHEHELLGTDVVGSSMGARLVLELARRGNVVGAVVSLDPGGFWAGWERHAFHASIWLSVRLARRLQFAMPAITQSPRWRALLLTQLSAQAAALAPSLVLEEMRSYATAPSFDRMLRDLVRGAAQEGAASGSLGKPLVIGWGRLDRVCLARQAARARLLFPDARLHWFERSGHFPHWDAPEETARLILETTAD